MSESRAQGRTSSRRHAAAAPTIFAGTDYAVVGTGFLPDHEVLVRVTYTAKGVSDYLTYRTDSRGCLNADLPISPHGGVLEITATDRRDDPDGDCGLLWSNTHTVRAVSA
jgi:hypothetical protein